VFELQLMLSRRLYQTLILSLKLLADLYQLVQRLIAETSQVFVARAISTGAGVELGRIKNSVLLDCLEQQLHGLAIAVECLLKQDKLNRYNSRNAASFAPNIHDHGIGEYLHEL
jgi:hypothetical protein